MLLSGYIDKVLKSPLGDIKAPRDGFEMPEKELLRGDPILPLRKSKAHDEGSSARTRVDFREKFRIDLGFPFGTSLISIMTRLRIQPLPFFMQTSEEACRSKITWVSTNSPGISYLN